MNIAIKKASILLPSPGIDPAKWAVIACDQFSSQPEYWEQADAIVGDAPSTLRLTLPEAYLAEAPSRVPAIHETMNRYVTGGVLTEAVNGFVLVERVTPSGVRPGLMVTLDLECYDPASSATSLIRATEDTVSSRVPPRARIRSGAPIEVPHVMMLIDDPARSVIEPIYLRRNTLRSLYDFDLMLDGGHLRGWAVENEPADSVIEALEQLSMTCSGLLYAVGDGNHSLAAARQCWLQIRGQLTEEQRKVHPARYAMVELVNIHCPSLNFEPIHRVLFGVNSVELVAELRAHLHTRGIPDAPGHDLVAFDKDARITFRIDNYPLPLLQNFLDQYLAAHTSARIDYIHGEKALKDLVAAHPDAMGFIPRALQKSELFNTIRRWGPLPRKSFSIGSAKEKRYYMETRKIL